MLLLNGCVTMIAGNMGAGATAVAVAETVDQAKTAADVVAYGTTGKTLTDHAISQAVGKDCQLLNVLEKKNVCRIRKIYAVHFYNTNGVSFRWVAPPKPKVGKPKPVKIKYKKKPKRKR